MHAAPVTESHWFHAKTRSHEEERKRTTKLTKITKPLCIAGGRAARAARNKGASRQTRAQNFSAEHLGVLGGLGVSNLFSSFFAASRLRVSHSALATNDPQRTIP
jgi:hypothetical protein